MKLFSLLPKRLIHFACNSPVPMRSGAACGLPHCFTWSGKTAAGDSAERKWLDY